MRARVLSTVVAAACVWGAVSTTAQAQVSEQAQFYAQHNLVSDVPGAADRVDPLLVNAWGLVAGPTTPWWVADNGSDSSTLYTGAGMPVPLLVSVPGAPTGIVFNSQAGVFLVNGSAARFIFATEDGTILGWNGGTSATIIHPSDGGIYKGLAIDQTPGHARLYVTVGSSCITPTTTSGTPDRPPRSRPGSPPAGARSTRPWRWRRCRP